MPFANPPAATPGRYRSAICLICHFSVYVLDILAYGTRSKWHLAPSKWH